MQLRTHPQRSSLVVPAAIAVTVATHDLARGVLLSALFFARKVGRMLISPGPRAPMAATPAASAGSCSSPRPTASSPRSTMRTRRRASPSTWRRRTCATSALDKVVLKFRRPGAQVLAVGLNEASAAMVGQLGTHQRADAGAAPPH